MSDTINSFMAGGGAGDPSGGGSGSTADPAADPSADPSGGAATELALGPGESCWIRAGEHTELSGEGTVFRAARAIEGLAV